MLSNSFIYSLKIWLTSVVLAPVIYLTIAGFVTWSGNADFTDVLNEGFEFYGLSLFFGALFSVPTFIIFAIIVEGVTYYRTGIKQIKFVIAGVGVILTFGTFAAFLFPDNKDSEAVLLMISNALCIAGGAFFYKLGGGETGPISESS